jgi:hypothetical protein
MDQIKFRPLLVAFGCFLLVCCVLAVADSALSISKRSIIRRPIPLVPPVITRRLHAAVRAAVVALKRTPLWYAIPCYGLLMRLPRVSIIRVML